MDKFNKNLKDLIVNSEVDLKFMISGLATSIWLMFAKYQLSDKSIEMFFSMIREKPEGFDILRDRLNKKGKDQ